MPIGVLGDGLVPAGDGEGEVEADVLLVGEGVGVAGSVGDGVPVGVVLSEGLGVGAGEVVGLGSVGDGVGASVVESGDGDGDVEVDGDGDGDAEPVDSVGEGSEVPDVAVGTTGASPRICLISPLKLSSWAATSATEYMWIDPAKSKSRSQTPARASSCSSPGAWSTDSTSWWATAAVMQR